MREIKFRGKRLDNGDWVYGDLVRIPHDGGSWGEPPSQELDWHITNSRVLTHEWVKIDTKTVGQFTGLLDCGGKEIYEGDIVGFEDCTSTESGYYEQNCIGVVGWSNETVGFEVSNRLSADSCDVLNECVVVGNIYENPELLT